MKARRSQCVAATALAPTSALGRWPSVLLAAPLALAPAGAGATTFDITATACTLTGGTICGTKTVLKTAPTTAPAFQGGVLTLNNDGHSYSTQFTLDTSTTNTLNQDANKTMFTGIFSDATSGGNITITNASPSTGDPTSGGFVNFNAAETYTGTTTINSGAVLRLGSSGSIASSSTVVTDGRLNLALAAPSVSITSLSGSGSVMLHGGQTLTLSNPSGTFSGVIGEWKSSGSLAITTGTEVLSGANRYTGTTTVGAGSASPATLVLNGSLKSSTTTVSAGSTLTGVGSTSGNVVNNGTVKPFNTVTNKTGTLSVGGNFTQNSTGVLDFEIGGTTAGTYSTLAVTGAAALAGTLAVQTVNSYLFPNAATTYDNIVSYGSLSSLNFSNLTYNGNSCAPHGMETWSCHHITFQAINLPSAKGVRLHVAPEPGTLAVLGTSLLGLLALRRRRA
jgi:hypothetical protein